MVFVQHGPGTHSERPNEGNRLGTHHVQLDFPMSSSCPRHPWCSLTQKLPFLAQNSPKALSTQPNKQEIVDKLHMLLVFLMSKSPCVPSESTTCLRNAPTRPIFCQFATHNPKPTIGCILGFMAQKVIPLAPKPPTTLHLLWFPPLRMAQTDAHTPAPLPTRPQYAASWSRKLGAKIRQRGPTGAKKKDFQKRCWTTWDAKTGGLSPL